MHTSFLTIRCLYVLHTCTVVYMDIPIPICKYCTYTHCLHLTQYDLSHSLSVLTFESVLHSLSLSLSLILSLFLSFSAFSLIFPAAKNGLSSIVRFRLVKSKDCRDNFSAKIVFREKSYSKKTKFLHPKNFSVDETTRRWCAFERWKNLFEFGPFKPPLFLYFSPLSTTVASIQFCWWLDSNRRHLVLEATALPTDPVSI